MKRILIFLIVFVAAFPLWSAETGLFTYEGGFFVKSGNAWKEYRPKDKPRVWATYTQYNEETNYYNIKNDNCTLAIPKTSNNNFYKRVNGEWKVVYNTRIIYPSFTDTSVRIFCFSKGYYVRDGKKWRLYLSEKPNAIWASFEQYNENDKVYVPKRADLSCFLWDKNKNEWSANWSITEIYDHI